MRVAGFHGLIAGSRDDGVVEQPWCAAAGSRRDRQFGTQEAERMFAIGSVQGGQNEGHVDICLTYCQRFDFCQARGNTKA